MSSAPSKPPKDLSTLALNDHVALTGKSGSLIWIGKSEFELDGRMKILFSPDELTYPDKIVITGNKEAWLLRDDLLYKVRLYNIPMAHYPTSHKLHAFQRCIWNGLFNTTPCPEIKRAAAAPLIFIDEKSILALIRACEILPACDDGSEWRMLTSSSNIQSESAESNPNVQESRLGLHRTLNQQHRAI